MALTKAQGKFSQAIDDGADSTAITIDSSGNVLVDGTTFNNGNFSGSASGINVFGVAPMINLVETGGNTSVYIGKSSSAAFIGTEDSHPIRFVTNDAERMRILASGGVTFNGDTAAANALDDYEEGTWTPTLVPTTGSFGSITYGTQLGFYTKTGDVVTAHARIDTTSMSIGSAGGYLCVHNFPYTANGNAYQSITVGYCWGWNTNWPSGGAMGGGTTKCFLYTNQGDANSAVVVPSNLGTGQTYLYVSVSYKIT